MLANVDQLRYQSCLKWRSKTAGIWEEKGRWLVFHGVALEIMGFSKFFFDHVLFFFNVFHYMLPARTAGALKSCLKEKVGTWGFYHEIRKKWALLLKNLESCSKGITELFSWWTKQKTAFWPQPSCGVSNLTKTLQSCLSLLKPFHTVLRRGVL